MLLAVLDAPDIDVLIDFVEGSGVAADSDGRLRAAGSICIVTGEAEAST